jgi:hypothetical protein
MPLLAPVTIATLPPRSLPIVILRLLCRVATTSMLRAGAEDRYRVRRRRAVRLQLSGMPALRNPAK